jgi:hypothetical protein
LQIYFLVTNSTQRPPFHDPAKAPPPPRASLFSRFGTTAVPDPALSLFVAADAGGLRVDPGGAALANHRRFPHSPPPPLVTATSAAIRGRRRRCRFPDLFHFFVRSDCGVVV